MTSYTCIHFKHFVQIKHNNCCRTALVRLVCAGVDFWRRVVLHLAGCGRLDVHGLHLEPVRHLSGPLRGSNASSHVPQHHVLRQGEASNRR